MAKKKAAAKKPAPKAKKVSVKGRLALAAKRLRSSRSSSRAAGVAAARGPRSQVLPGHEQVRNARLDNFCESIADGRARKNVLIAEEKGDLQGALREMHDTDERVYRHAGVELVRVPGEEKLRVRTTKEDASDITNDQIDAVDAKYDAEAAGDGDSQL